MKTILLCLSLFSILMAQACTPTIRGEASSPSAPASGSTAPPPVTPSFGSHWRFEGNPRFTSGAATWTSIAFDSNNQTYVVFRDGANTNKATVQKWDGTSWSIVGSAGFSAGAAAYTSIAIDSDDTPYVAYQDAGNANKITVMQWNGANWAAVGSAGFSTGTAVFTSIAIDSSNAVYVVYSDASVGAGKAVVKKWSGAAWDLVGTEGFSTGVASYTTIAIDSDDIPTVAFADAGSASKAVAMKWSGSAWDVLGTTVSSGAATRLSIAIDSSDLPYVAYYQNGANLSKWNGSSWSLVGGSAISTNVVNTYDVSVALDSADHPYISFVATHPTNRAVLMKYESSTWQVVGDTVLSELSAAYPKLALDSSDNPYVVFQENSSKASVMTYQPELSLPTQLAWLEYSPYAVGDVTATWTRSQNTALSNQKIQFYSDEYCNTVSGGVVDLGSTTLESYTYSGGGAGQFHTYRVISYLGTAEPVYSSCARQMGFNAISLDYLGPAWQLIPGERGHRSVAIDSNDVSYVAYLDPLYNGKVSVIKNSGSTWSYVGTPGFADVKPYYSTAADVLVIAVGPDQSPHVAYWDESFPYKVVVKKFNGTVWESIGERFTDGIGTSTTAQLDLAIDSTGTPVVVAEAIPSGGIPLTVTVMKYVSGSWSILGGASWSYSTNGPPVLSIDSDDVIYVAYTDSDNGDALTVKKYASGAWSLVGGATVAATAANGFSFALDPTGIPYVAYGPGGFVPLKVKKFIAGWQDVNDAWLSANTMMPLNIIIGLGPSGTPYVSIWDIMLGRLFIEGTWSTALVPADTFSVIVTDSAENVYLACPGSSAIRKYVP